MMPHALRTYRGVITDTSVWSRFAIRSDDVIVSTPPKSGTTWMLHLVNMLLAGRVKPGAGGPEHAPWLDNALRDETTTLGLLESFKHRRCIKTHAPLDAVPVLEEPTYVVVYRHPVDVHFSMRAHAENMKRKLFDHLFPADELEGLDRFIQGPMTEAATDDLTLASVVHHYAKALELKARSNVHFFHYADLTRDLKGQVARLAEVLNVSLPPETLSEIATATTFDAMRTHVEEHENRFHPQNPFHDPANFYADGMSNKWEGRVPDSMMHAYTQRLAALLPEGQARWLEWGDQS